MTRSTGIAVIAFMAALLLCIGVPGAMAAELRVSRFDSEGLAGWESKSFKGHTEYLIQHENGHAIVMAVSRASASGMYRKIHFDPATYRYLRWSWKIAHTISGGDERSKSGDDYAARVYVLFPGRYFWQMKAIVYIWANRLPVGESIPNPYTSSAKMVAVESGDGKAGQWLTEERDLYADYRRLFGQEPHDAEAVAIMTDTDNTGGSAEAWYGAITLATDRR